MLVLSRQNEESIELQIPPSDQPRVVTITVKRIDQTRVRLGTEAPREITIVRTELKPPQVETWPVVTVADDASLEVAKRQYGAA